MSATTSTSLSTHRPGPPANPPLILSAYQCGPGMGSVSQIGWEWYSRLAGRLPLTLVTHSRNRAALEKAGAPLRLLRREEYTMSGTQKIAVYRSTLISCLAMWCFSA